MRKPLIIAGSIVGVLVLVVVAIFIYAAANLNSLIAQNQEFLLERASSALGRKVEIGEIKAHLGWGVSADLTDLKIADDSDFSSQPFVSAANVSAKVDLLPLLARELRVSKIVLEQPQIRIVRNADGELNVSTIGRKAMAEGQAESEQRRNQLKQPSPLSEAPEKSRKGGAALNGLEVHNFSIAQGQVEYLAAGQPPIAISQIDLDVSNFSFVSPFDLSLQMAALGDSQNVKLTGQLGPIASGAGIDVNAIPLDLHLQAGPFELAEIRKLEFAKTIPPKLEVSDKFSLDLTAKGEVAALSLHAASDLTSNQISFGDLFQKPAGTTLKVDFDANRKDTELGISQAKVALGDLDLTATGIKIVSGVFSGKIDTNRFDIASLAKLAPSAVKLGITGKSEIHTNVSYAGGKASANGVVSLAGVTIPRPGQGGTAVSDLNGDIKLAGSSADVGPLSFKLGAGNATLTAHSSPIYPPQATYEFTADSLRTADFSPKRPANEQLNRVRASGNFSMGDDGFADDNKLTSPSGNLNNIAYTDLLVVSSLAGKNLRVSQLQIGAFGGSISGNANATLEDGGPFNAAATMASLNLQQALQSQNAKAAGVVRGFLNGRVQISGKNNGDFDKIKPTLAGNGQAQVMQGKLVGVNIGARVFEKTQNLPVIGSLIPQSIANNHPELFNSPDTDFQQLGLTFVIQGPRISTNDLVMKTADYAMNGDGWFDMDKNIDLTARILLTRQLTNEIIAQKKNVVYVTNDDGQIDVPLRITGQLPKPSVLPDIGELAQRASQRAVQEQAQKGLGKVLGKKGLGGFLGGSGGGSGGGTGGGTNESGNPLNQLKGLFGR
jgi:uncharacterized protein involved in outer membrane biogenesis